MLKANIIIYKDWVKSTMLGLKYGKRTVRNWINNIELEHNSLFRRQDFEFFAGVELWLWIGIDTESLRGTNTVALVRFWLEENMSKKKRVEGWIVQDN